MTNIALTTLVILLLAVPGFIFRASYFSEMFTSQILPKNMTEDIASGIVWSVPFHVIGVFAADLLKHHDIIHTTLNFEILARMLSGIFADQGEEFKNIIDRIYDNSFHLSAYYLLVLLAAFLAGHGARKLVWKWELDLRFPRLFEFRNVWIYILLGRGKLKPETPDQKVVVYIDALTELASEMTGKTRLYRGLVAGFTTDDSGTLRDIFLTGAYRGKLNMTSGIQGGFEWRRISPGDYFTLKYSDIQNLNITYELYPPVSPDQNQRSAEVER